MGRMLFTSRAAAMVMHFTRQSLVGAARISVGRHGPDWPEGGVFAEVPVHGPSKPGTSKSEALGTMAP